MKLVTVSQMQVIEKEADANGLTYDQMMHNAGLGLANAIFDFFADEEELEAVGLIGPGNNGGDTLVALAALSRSGTPMPLSNRRRLASSIRSCPSLLATSS